MAARVFLSMLPVKEKASETTKLRIEGEVQLWSELFSFNAIVAKKKLRKKETSSLRSSRPCGGAWDAIAIRVFLSWLGIKEKISEKRNIGPPGLAPLRGRRITV